MDQKQEKKKFTLQVNSNPDDPTIYSDFLVRSSEKALYIDFAERRENKDEVIIEVKKTIAIPADKMLDFMARILSEMINYETKYQNGKGIRFPKKE